MKGYMVTPIVFIALFMIAAVIFLNHITLSAEYEKQFSSSLVSSRAGNEYWKKMLACTARAYETIKTEYSPDRSVMEQRIEQRILEHDELTADVILENASGKVKVSVTPLNYKVTGRDLEYDYTGRTYSAVLGIDYTFTG